MKSFDYLGYVFVPVGKLPQGFDFFEVTRKCRSIGISNYCGGEYSHTEFYRVATKICSGEVDIFLMDGSVVVLPCENELFEYRGDFRSL